MKTGMKVFLIITIVLLLVVALSSAAVSAFSFLNTKQIKTAVEDLANQSVDEDPAQEDDVCIADEYYIRSTLPISDAYKSGDTSALDDRQKETLKMASDILDQIIEEGMTPFEKEKAVYEWLTTKLKSSTNMLVVIPESNVDGDNPYDVLKSRNAVCVGYATTFRLFMQMMDIECKVVHDTSTTHSWDLIKLDGDWYHTDCYFDSDTGTYAGFNMNDVSCSRNHDWNRDFFPHANGIKYNYAVMNAVTLDDIYAIPSFAKESIDEGAKCFSCRIKGGISDEDQPAASMISEQVLEAVQSTMEGGFEYYWTKDADGDFVLCMYHYSYNDDDDPDNVPEETAEKIRQAVEDVFGEYEYYYNDYDDENYGIIVGEG